MKSLRLFQAFIATTGTILIGGCASTDEVILDSSHRAPTSNVEIFKDGVMPDRKFNEIAELTFLGPREDELRAQRRFIQKAKTLGGNGLIFSVAPAGIKGGGTAFQTTAWFFKGKVIVFE